MLACILGLTACQSVKPSAGLRLGYLTNITHAVPIVGIETKHFTNIEPQYFSSGGYLLNALMSGKLDIAYIGPGPYLNALSKKVDLVLLSVVTYGGNSLIVNQRFSLDRKHSLRRMAVPQLGNTQDLLAKILVDNIETREKQYQEISAPVRQMLLQSTLTIAQDFDYIAVNPSELEVAFFTNAVDSALVSEPWGTILEEHGLINLSALAEGRHLDKLSSSKVPANLLSELEGVLDSKFKQELLAINDYPTTVLVVERNYYKANKAKVDKFITEQSEILDYIRNNKSESVKFIQAHLTRVLEKEFDYNFLAQSFDRVRFSNKVDYDKFEKLYQAALKAFYIRYPIDLKASLQ